MKGFIITSLCLSLLNMLGRLGFLSWSDYPRSVKWSRGDDALVILMRLGWITWAAWLLCGAQ